MSGPTGSIADAIAEYHAASLAVWDDEAVWIEERASAERRLMAWPRPYKGTKANHWLSALFNADVDLLLAILKERDDPESPAWPPDTRDPKMQVLLRVVQRSMVAGNAAIVAGFGGLELNGKRDYTNGVMEALADLAWRSGLPRAKAFDTFGIAKRRGYRAIKRGVTKKIAPKK